ncbi:MAG: acyl-CoA thioester hydrolase/BAAT C-terminal domain-containing protein [Pseudomonadota bacterium]
MRRVIAGMLGAALIGVWALLPRDQPSAVSVRPLDITRPAVIFLGGSEGGYLNANPLYRKLRSQHTGIAELAYFSFEGGPQHLREVEINAIADQIASFESNPECLAIVGVSKGAELALLLASHFDLSVATVAVVPSNVVWQSPQVSLLPRSSWALEGQAVPFLRYDMVSIRAIRAALDYNNALALHEAAIAASADGSAEIPVEDISQQVLLQAATRDQIWPSVAMSRQVVRRANANGRAGVFTLKVYDHDHYLLSNRNAVDDLAAFLRRQLSDCKVGD